MYNIFIAANPFLIALTPPTIEVNFSDLLELSFQAANNSDGRMNFLTFITLEHTSIDGIETNFIAVQDPTSSNAQIFITDHTARGNLAGTFIACKSHNIVTVILDLYMLYVIYVTGFGNVHNLRIRFLPLRAP